jgi:hypothetical protein
MSEAFDLRRLRGIVVVLAGVAVATSAFGVPVRMLSGRPNRSFARQESKMDLDSYALVGRRIAGAVRQGTKEGESLAVLLGSSSLEYGIDPTVLPGEYRWLSLFGHDLNIDDLKECAELLDRSPLKPELLGLVINAGMLAQPTDASSSRGSGKGQADRPGGTDRSTLPWLDVESRVSIALEMVFPGRSKLNLFARRRVFQAKLQFFESIGVGVNSLFLPDADPWSVRLPGNRQHAPKSVIAVQKESLRERGWFDTLGYSLDSPNCSSLVELITRSRSRGMSVFIVLMPEPSELRNAVPREAKRILLNTLLNAFDKNAPPVLDFEDALPDSSFNDLLHLSGPGNRSISRLLGKRLTDLSLGRAAAQTSPTRDVSQP